eukprot:6525042-Pyramimonas_sp.AAC.1
MDQSDAGSVGIFSQWTNQNVLVPRRPPTPSPPPPLSSPSRLSPESGESGDAPTAVPASRACRPSIPHRLLRQGNNAQHKRRTTAEELGRNGRTGGTAENKRGESNSSAVKRRIEGLSNRTDASANPRLRSPTSRLGITALSFDRSHPAGGRGEFGQAKTPKGLGINYRPQIKVHST